MSALDSLAALGRRPPPDAERLLRKLRRVLARIPFAEDLVAAWLCALDPRTPARVRHILLGAVAYFLLPADLVPDFLVGFGFTDDAAVVALVLRTLGSHIEPHHRAEARRRVERLRGGVTR